MRSFLLKNKWFFLIFTLLGWALRGYFLKHYALIDGDSLIYGEIAKNWMEEGVFGMRELDQVVPTLIRLPGYPAFLVIIFKIFGTEHYTAVLRAQLVIDLATCFVIADMARRTVSDRAAKTAFVLAALCPFTASYCALPLSETLSIFFTALALLGAICALQSQAYKHWVLCGLALAASILLRPDNGILLPAILLYLGWRWVRSVRSGETVRALRILASGTILTVVALAPLVPWALRNWQVFHVFQPLAPRYANAPGEFVPMGFNRWMRTWSVEFVSTYDVYWKVSAESRGEELNFKDIPRRAFDTPQQRDETAKLIEEYNQSQILTRELDKRFAQLAQERVRRSYLRYYIWLPFLRVADMWLRPRTEMLNLELHWWDFEDTEESLISIAYGALDVVYIFWALMGLRRRAGVQYAGMLLLFIILRSILLATLENPEPRYTLECFPAIIVLAGAGLSSVGWRRKRVLQEVQDRD